MPTNPSPESRIFPALAVLAVPVMMWLMPQRYQIMPPLTPFVIGGALAASMLAAGFSPQNSILAKVERYAAEVILPLVFVLELVLLQRLLVDMIHKGSAISGITLLSTSIGIWVGNVIVFALVYWQMDRGGATRRPLGWKGRADFTFPRGDPGDGVPEDWLPTFPDYLALAFNTSSAFSPTDVLPLTVRAKMLMVVQSAVSLVTVIAVGARAINILGS